jgi:hypothetical protein
MNKIFTAVVAALSGCAVHNTVLEQAVAPEQNQTEMPEQFSAGDRLVSEDAAVMGTTMKAVYDNSIHSSSAMYLRTLIMYGGEVKTVGELLEKTSRVFRQIRPSGSENALTCMDFYGLDVEVLTAAKHAKESNNRIRQLQQSIGQHQKLNLENLAEQWQIIYHASLTGYLDSRKAYVAVCGETNP